MTDRMIRLETTLLLGIGDLSTLTLKETIATQKTRDQSHGVKDTGQEGDAPKKTDRSGYYNEDDLQVWKDRYLRRNEDPSRRDAKPGGMSAPKEITFKYRRTHPE